MYHEIRMLTTPCPLVISVMKFWKRSLLEVGQSWQLDNLGDSWVYFVLYWYTSAWKEEILYIIPEFKVQFLIAHRVTISGFSCFHSSSLPWKPLLFPSENKEKSWRDKNFYVILCFNTKREGRGESKISTNALVIKEFKDIWPLISTLISLKEKGHKPLNWKTVVYDPPPQKCFHFQHLW